MRDYIDIQEFVDEQEMMDYNVDMDNNSNMFWNEVDILPSSYYNYNKQ